MSAFWEQIAQGKTLCNEMNKFYQCEIIDLAILSYHTLYI